jgi:lipoate-protein ligase A
MHKYSKMKKQTFFILLATISTVVNTAAQDKIASYNSSFFSKNFDVTATKPDEKGIYSYYIDCYSRDTSSKQVSLILKSNEIPEVIEFLNSLKDTFSKWSITAKENKVTELDKNIDYKKLTYSAAFSYGKWNFDFSVKITSRFKIIDNKYLIIVDSDELQSSSNQYIKSTGFRIVFSSVEEIDEFIKCLDVSKVQSFFNSKNSKEDLFKN